jgi:hypothetical protein
MMASDLVVSDARSALDTMLVTVAALKTAEREHHRVQRAAFSEERWSILAPLAALWALGLIALAVTPGRRAATTPGTASAEPAESESIGAIRLTPPAPLDSTARRRAVDLVAAADLCVSLSRLSSTAALPGLLSQAAALLDASGVILWMAAGEELFAAAAHGYKPNLLARLGPIPRSAANATAATWREGRLTVVRGERDEPGAMVVPMFGPDSCIGVLSLEIKGGREQDTGAQAVASMVAAQLATALAAWPAASREIPAHQATRDRRSAGA